uniref:ADP-ribosylation factor 1 n=1 Tax=Magallana gigas TaxID=29159 RepID=A0A8W8MHY6_MAGGI
MLEEAELRDAILLVFANKQDLPNAMSASESQRNWDSVHYEDESGIFRAHVPHKEQGLYEGLDWLSNELSNQ